MKEPYMIILMYMSIAVSKIVSRQENESDRGRLNRLSVDCVRYNHPNK